jgi:hypothetical protein
MTCSFFCSCVPSCSLSRGCVSFASPIIALPSWQQPSAARSTVSSSLVPHTIAQLVDSPPRSRRLWCQRLQMSRPWNEVKSRRGAPKRVNTEGFACPNRECPYFGITDTHIHALVGDGKHGCAERIQTFRCQACHTTFTARRHTALYRLKTLLSRSQGYSLHWPKGWTHPPRSGSSVTGRQLSPPG